MKPGIYDGISNEAYHANDALSKSGMVYFDRYPAYYKYRQEHPQDTTKAMLDGTQFHTATLEPDRYRKEYTVAPACDRRTKAGKALWSEFTADNTGKVIVPQKDWDMVAGMVASIEANEDARSYLSGGLVEQSVFWDDPEYGFPCQCRPDYMKPGEYSKYGQVIDLKSCQDATFNAFQKQIVNYKYHWQAAHYLNGLNQVAPHEYTEFIFIAVEKTPPYTCCVYPFSQEDADATLTYISNIYADFSYCLETGIWPEPRTKHMTLPDWEKTKIGAYPF